MTNQLVFTFPERELYGVFNGIELLRLRIKYVNGEIPEQLCFLDKDDRAYVWDEFACISNEPEDSLFSIEFKLLSELVQLQSKKRIENFKSKK